MEFENLGYRELQNLCKDFGLRANGKSAELKERLRDYKLKLQASTTSHRRSSVNSNLAFPISALQEDETGLNIDETSDVECPKENNDENKCSNTRDLNKEKKRKSSIVSVFMEHITNNTKKLSLSEKKETDLQRTHTDTADKENDEQSSFLPRMTVKALAMTKAVMKNKGEKKTTQSNQDLKEPNKEIKSTIPKVMPLTTKKVPKQIQINKPLSWKPHTGKVKEFTVDAKSIIREAGPYDENITNSKLKDHLNSMRKNTAKEKKPLSVNKPLTYKPHTGKLKPATF